MAIKPFFYYKLPDRLTNLTTVGRVYNTVRGRGRKISVSDAYFVKKVGEFLESD